MTPPNPRVPARRPAAGRLHLACVAAAGALAFAGAALAVRPLRAQQAPLTLMTWNVGTLNPFAYRLPASHEDDVVRAVAAEAPDVVALQEVGSAAQARRVQDALRARGLDYDLTVARSVVSRHDGRLTATLHPPGLGATLIVAPSADAEMAVVSTARVAIVNVHGPANGGHRARARYFDAVRRWAAQAGVGSVVVAGDFNLGPGYGAGLSLVLPWAWRTDRATFSGLLASFPEYASIGSTTFYGLAYDHVMATPGTRLRGVRRVRGHKRGLMDHDPVRAEVEAR